MRVIPSIFKGKNKEGDFNWMIKQKEYSNVLFLFNDNYENFNNCFPGAGNAIMRQYNKHSLLQITKSAGIPTGSINYGGFGFLSIFAKEWIDIAFHDIHDLLSTHEYDSVIFSADKNGKIGNSIFTFSEDVRDYITEQIYTLEYFSKV